MAILEDLTPAELTQGSHGLAALNDLVAQDMDKVNTVIFSLLRSKVELIPELAGYIVTNGGKRLRPMLTIACSKMCGYGGERHVRLATAVEFIHTATLLHDDVVDESALRRGKPSANAVWNNQASVLVGDFLLSQAFRLMVADGSLEVLKILSDASAVIAEGEVKQLVTAKNPDTSRDDYLDVISSKTAKLFAAACELGAVVSEKEDLRPHLRRFGQNLGVAFQLVDDALDYVAEQEELGKTVGDDFRERKITLPVIIALEHATAGERAFWHRTIRQGKQKDGDFNQAVVYLQKYKAIEETLKLAEEYSQRAQSCLQEFGEGRAKTALQKTLLFCVERAY